MKLKNKVSSWEESFFKVNFIKKGLLLIIPKMNSIKGFKYRKLINDSGEYTRLEYVYLRKVLSALCAFAITIVMCFSLHNVNKTSILENSADISNSNILITSDGQKDSMEIENSMLEYVDLNDIPGSRSEIIYQLGRYGIHDNIESIADRIIAKEIAIKGEYLRIYDYLLALLFSIIAYNIPEFVLKLKTNMRKYDMQNEIILFETIILIFMYHENATPELVLEYMLKFADIFKPQLEDILKELRRYDFEALEKIQDDIKYKPLLSLIKNLIKAENIKTSEAFISLAENRRDFLINRKEENKRIVSKRVSNGNLISLIPIGMVIIAYISIPMLYVSLVQTGNMQEQLLDLNSDTVQEQNINN